MPSNLFDLTGRVALVSGAAQGLGRAMSLALAEFGADVMLADLNEAGLASTAETLNSKQPHKFFRQTSSARPGR